MRCQSSGVVTTGVPTFTQDADMTFIDEPNLYRCIFQSHKAEAQKFQDWVFEEVLPKLRQDGGYIITNASMSDKEIMNRAVLIAQRAIDDKDKKIEEQEK